VEDPDQVRVVRLAGRPTRFDEGTEVTVDPGIAKGPAIYLENTLYPLAPGQRATLDEAQRRSFLATMAQLHRDDRHIVTNCLFDPGVAFEFMRKREADEVGKGDPYQRVATMLVCFKCGEMKAIGGWGSRIQTILGGSYDPLLVAAKSAFPKDAELQAVQPRGK
jgi:hypothetical protein